MVLICFLSIEPERSKDRKIGRIRDKDFQQELGVGLRKMSLEAGKRSRKAGQRESIFRVFKETSSKSCIWMLPDKSKNM